MALLRSCRGQGIDHAGAVAGGRGEAAARLIETRVQDLEPGTCHWGEELDMTSIVQYDNMICYDMILIFILISYDFI